MIFFLRLSIFSILLFLSSIVSIHAASPSDEKKGEAGHHTDHPPHDHPTKKLKKVDNSTHRRKESKKLN